MKWEKHFDVRLGFAVHEAQGFTALVSRDGPDRFWHLSISRQDRYPVWDEIKEARYDLIPDGVTMAMFLPPKGQYVNVHPNCFHLHEVRGVTHDFHL